MKVTIEHPDLISKLCNLLAKAFKTVFLSRFRTRYGLCRVFAAGQRVAGGWVSSAHQTFSDSLDRLEYHPHPHLLELVPVLFSLCFL